MATSMRQVVESELIFAGLQKGCKIQNILCICTFIYICICTQLLYQVDHLPAVESGLILQNCKKVAK